MAIHGKAHEKSTARPLGPPGADPPPPDVEQYITPLPRSVTRRDAYTL